MAKLSGLGDVLLVDGSNISGDVTTANLAGPRGVLPVTGLDKSAVERIYGLRDGSVAAMVYFNDEALYAHDVFKGLTTADRGVMYLKGQTRGGPGGTLIAKQVSYDPTRGADGSLTLAVNGTGNGYGQRWGEQVSSGVETIASAGNSTGIDGGAQTTKGLTAHIQVISIGSGTPTVKLQDSADNSTYADIPAATFGTVAAGTSKVVATTASETIDQYVRIVTTGTFTDLVIAVVIIRGTATVPAGS